MTTSATTDTPTDLHLSPSQCHHLLLDQITPSMSYDGGDVRAWQQRLRRKLRTLVGMPTGIAFTPPGKTATPPGKRVPLNVRTLWQKSTDLGTIDKIAFTAEPYSDVVAYMCIPHSVKPPYHCIICLQGHSTGMHNSISMNYEETEPVEVEGDRDFGNQCLRNGVAALCIEQRSFGQRKEHVQKMTAPHMCHDATMHALMLGRTLLGERVFDVDRGIDYLASRRDIRMRTLGVMGNSGGGTVSMFAGALLQRVRMAVPSCYFCSYTHSIMNIYHCADNYVPSLALYATAADIMGLFAPRPVVIVAGQTDKIFPIEGVHEAFADLKRIYTAAGAPDACHLVVGPEGHRFYANQAWPLIRPVLGI